MEVFDAIPKQWGNSIGITIPKEILEKEHITLQRRTRFLVIGAAMEDVKKSFGSLKFKKPTQQIMDEIDEGYD